MAALEQWRNQLQNTRGSFQNFRLSYVRQIQTIGKTDDKTNPPSSMCNLVLTSDAYRAVESCRRLSSFARLLTVRVFKFRAA